MFQIWNCYHNKLWFLWDFVWALYQKIKTNTNKNTPGDTQTLLNFSDAVFWYKLIMFCHNIPSITKQTPNMDPWLSDLSNEMCFVKLTNIFDFLKHKPHNLRVYICVFISWFIPLKEWRIPWETFRDRLPKNVSIYLNRLITFKCKPMPKNSFLNTHVPSSLCKYVK